MSNGTFAENRDPYSGATDHEEGKVETAKHEASDLKDTATDAAKDVAGTVKDETSAVAHETKAQVQDLYHQTRRELSDQASAQQQRLAAGLGSVGDELGSMARNAEGSGIAADLVRRAGDRASSAASWLQNRDPAGVLDDVRAFARRRPAVFIGAALVAGIVAGRLVRALASNARDDADGASPSGSGTPARVGATSVGGSSAAPDAIGGTSPAGATASAGSMPAVGGAALAGGTAAAGGMPAAGDETSVGSEESDAAAWGDTSGFDASRDVDVTAAIGVEDDSPLYEESAKRFENDDQGAAHDRPDAF